MASPMLRAPIKINPKAPTQQLVATQRPEHFSSDSGLDRNKNEPDIPSTIPPRV